MEYTEQIPENHHRNEFGPARKAIKPLVDTMQAQLSDHITKILDSTTDELSNQLTAMIEKLAPLIPKQQDLAQEVSDMVKSAVQITNKTEIHKAEVPPQIITILEQLAVLATKPVSVRMSDYRPHDQDNKSGYFGFVNSLGNWYIIRNSASGKQRYAAGNDSYAEAWEKRKSLKYSLLNEALA